MSQAIECSSLHMLIRESESAPSEISGARAKTMLIITQTVMHLNQVFVSRILPILPR